MKRSTALLVAILGISIFSMGFLGFGSKDKKTIAKVGSTAITIDDLNARISNFPANYQQALQQKENKEKLLDQMIDETVIYTAAKQEGLTKSEEYKKQLENAERAILINLYVKNNIDSKIAVTQEEIVKNYNDNANKYKETAELKAQHILVKTEEEAMKIYKVLVKSPNKFEEMAKQFSLDPSGKNGGEIGWFSRNELVPEFEQAAFALKKGEISKPVKSRFGYHVLRLVDSRTRPAVPLQSVQSHIQESLSMEKKQNVTSQTLTDLKAKFKVKKFLDKLDQKPEAAKK